MHFYAKYNKMKITIIYSIFLCPRYCEFCVSPLLGGEAANFREKPDRLIQFRTQSHSGVGLSEI